MRRMAALILFALAAFAADQPAVSRDAMTAVEKSVDGAIRGLDASDPYDLLGFTRGVYLPGYGVVLTAEVNLVITPITPFHTVPTGVRALRLHDKKVQRTAVIRQLMRRVLVDAAASLDGVPANERIVFGITFFYQFFEQRDGLPSQIVVQAERKALLDFKTNRINRAQLDAAIQAQEL